LDIRGRMESEGQRVPKKGEDPWDSNVITPGTEFMRRLSLHVKRFVEERMASSREWGKIQVIFSDASIPGEGEHKIIEHVRLQRAQMDYDPNMVHVLHGLDADLIMLALATHEMNFYILREEVVFGRFGAEAAAKRKERSGFDQAQRLLDEEVGHEAMDMAENKGKPLVRLSVPVLREYLTFEFSEMLRNIPFPADVERVIDDVVFMCFFVGNDFLPHLPSLDIRDGALDFLFNVYKSVFVDMGGYITNHGGSTKTNRGKRAGGQATVKEIKAMEEWKLFPRSWGKPQRF